jgi:hypothetical protein
MVTFPFFYFCCNRRIGTYSGICCRGAPAICRLTQSSSAKLDLAATLLKVKGDYPLEATTVILQVSESTTATTGPPIEWSIPPHANQ